MKKIEKKNGAAKNDILVCAATHMKSGEYKDYYKRKTEEGKHPMCVLNVIRAKLVSRMFAVIKRDEVYQRDDKIFTPTKITLKKSLPIIRIDS